MQRRIIKPQTLL